jgi:hypothetical protein
MSPCLVDLLSAHPESTSPEALMTASSGSIESSQAVAGEVGESLGAATTFATTEHFTLQAARSTTVTEASSRALGFLAVLSSSLIALAFIGQMSELGTAFYVFALVLLPVLSFIALVTFQRLVQVTGENIAYAQRIARLREFYGCDRARGRAAAARARRPARLLVPHLSF